MSEYGLYNIGVFWELYVPNTGSFTYTTFDKAVEKLLEKEKI